MPYQVIYNANIRNDSKIKLKNRDLCHFLKKASYRSAGT